MKAYEIFKEKRDQIISIANRYGTRNVRIFGSIGRGKGKRDSDLDLLVELEQGRSLLDIIAMKQDLEDLLNRKVDVVTEAALSPYLREEILHQAVNL